ncbi:hypothetical protein MIR68_011218 [Amoeboaphelidium protococcarum]|nr:hypothetical protein MIR68_011218 [Amoeboaphelidium protococcarum]
MEVQLDDLKKLKVAELKEKLQEYELPVSGKKDELIERLYNHLQSLAQQQQQQQQQVNQQQLLSPQVYPPQQQQQQQSGASFSASQQPPAMTQSVNVQMQHGTAITTKPAVDSPVSPQKDVVMQPALDPHKVIVIPPVELSSEISEEERRKRRAERFNIPYREPKKDDNGAAHNNNRRRQQSHDRIRGGHGGGSGGGGAMRNRLSGPRRDDRKSGGGGDRFQRGGRGGHRNGHGRQHRPRHDGHDKRDDGRRFEQSHGAFNNADSSMNPDAGAVSFSDQLQQRSHNEGAKFGWNTGANTASPPASEDVVMNE